MARGLCRQLEPPRVAQLPLAARLDPWAFPALRGWRLHLQREYLQNVYNFQISKRIEN